MAAGTKHPLVVALIGICVGGVADVGVADVEPGTRAFRACVACHALAPGRHMTGPSLADIWGKTAGSVPGFNRYSQALKRSEVVWDEGTLDAWLANPKAFIPANRMRFPGIESPEVRASLIALLKRVSESGLQAFPDLRGALSGPEMPDLENVGPEQRVRAIRYCGDTYRVTTEAGRTFPFWEFNLRFKTDSSDKGPKPGHPAIVGAGMRGDRAQIVFSRPSAISGSMTQECD